MKKIHLILGIVYIIWGALLYPLIVKEIVEPVVFWIYLPLIIIIPVLHLILSFLKKENHLKKENIFSILNVIVIFIFGYFIFEAFPLHSGFDTPRLEWNLFMASYLTSPIILISAVIGLTAVFQKRKFLIRELHWVYLIISRFLLVGLGSYLFVKFVILLI